MSKLATIGWTAGRAIQFGLEFWKFGNTRSGMGPRRASHYWLQLHASQGWQPSSPDSWRETQTRTQRTPRQQWSRFPYTLGACWVSVCFVLIRKRRIWYEFDKWHEASKCAWAASHRRCKAWRANTMAARRKKRSSKAPATRPREDEKEAKTDDILPHNQRLGEEIHLEKTLQDIW